jgi:glycosyltransferase involved in cell wall biosynthesis
MPKVTVSMPAYNSGKFIRESIESVLTQTEVDFELIVVDDASTDATSEIVQSFADPRIRCIRNNRRMGLCYCHNVVIRQSSTPFIAHVDSDDRILPGALLKMVQCLEGNSDLGQVHCHCLHIDEEAKLQQETFFTKRKRSIHKRTPNRNYRKDLIAHGNVINCLRTYRREVFEQVGYFNENLKRGGDYEMAVRLLEKYEIGLVPEFLYCHRSHRKNTSISRFEGLRSWVMRARLCHHLIKNRQITFITQEESNRLLITSLYHHVLKIDLMFYVLKTLSQKARWYLKNRISLLSIRNDHNQRKV